MTCTWVQCSCCCWRRYSCSRLAAPTAKIQSKPDLVKSAEPRLNHHLAGLFGVSSLAWTGHPVHVAIPESRGQHVGGILTTLPHPEGLKPFFTGDWVFANPDTAGICSVQLRARVCDSDILAFHPQTQSLWLTDMLTITWRSRLFHHRRSPVPHQLWDWS